jgi:predicted PurR-regulated permease PerM
MNGYPNDPMNGRGGVSEAVAYTLRQTSFLRVMVVLAATGVVLVIIRLGAPILNPIFFALVLSLLFSPIYSWLKRRGLPSPVALVIMLFLLGEGPAMMDRLRTGAGRDNPQVERLTAVGRSVVRQFGLRAIVNLVTGAGVTVLLFLLGVDFPLLWGILTFFFSFVPYIGLVLAVTPAVVLALAEFGVSRAVLVIAGVVVINVLAENVLSPVLMGRGLNISPTIVFLSFIFWAWLLGGPGAFLALPITLFVAVMLDTFPETRWLAGLMGITDADAGGADDAPGTPAQDGGAGPPT